MLNFVSELWCKRFHTQAMWPIHGKYVCSRCLREYPVAWEGPAQPAEYADPSLYHGRMVQASAPSLVQ